MEPLLTLLWVGLVTVLWVAITAGVWAMLYAPPESRSGVSRTTAND